MLLHMWLIFVPNGTFLVRFCRISGEFGQAMVPILATHSLAKIPMLRPNEPDIPLKRTKKVPLGIYTNSTVPPLFQFECFSTRR